jgi:archaemetzincin
MIPLALAAETGMEERVLIALSEALESSFPVEVRRVPPVGVPPEAYDAARGQHSAPLVLRALLSDSDPAMPKVLGLVEQDLFIPMLTFVFGQAQLGGRGALVSVARLQQEFYGLPHNEELLIARTCKEAVHEVGHLWGLIHCESPLCAMRLSTTIWNLDMKSARLCAACGEKTR